MHRLITFALIASLAGLWFVARADARVADPFESTKWKIRVEPEDANEAKAFDDIINFKGGEFTSREMKKFGFPAAKYDEDTRRGPIAAFTVEATSNKGATMKWTGNVMGNQVSGQLVWTLPEGHGIMTFNFKGERQG